MLSKFKTDFMPNQRDYDTIATNNSCKMEDPVKKAARDLAWDGVCQDSCRMNLKIGYSI